MGRTLAMTTGDVIDLRQFRAAQLERLLLAEAAEWERELRWDYTPSLQLIRQYVEARILPGYVLVEDGRTRANPHGYGFFVYESQKGLIGDLFVHPDYRTPECRQERRLLRHVIETLQASPGLRRIEAQLMPFTPPDLAPTFDGAGFRSYLRLFMVLELQSPEGAALAAEAAGKAASVARGAHPTQAWRTATFEEAAGLIQRAYERHVDSEVNDQYRTFAGAIRFLNNIVHYPGCGLFDEESSWIVRSPLSNEIEGMMLTSRVRSDVAHITQICVLPERQGLGLGRALICRAVAGLLARGFKAISLTVTDGNRNAVGLYRRLGFQTKRTFDAYVWER
jgi:ribosomal protein S18 acetylase RimI-like enzyme